MTKQMGEQHSDEGWRKQHFCPYEREGEAAGSRTIRPDNEKWPLPKLRADNHDDGVGGLC